MQRPTFSGADGEFAQVSGLAVWAAAAHLYVRLCSPMQSDPDIFYKAARQEFDFLVTEYGFSPSPFQMVSYPASSIDFESPAVRIRPFWDRGEIGVGLWVNLDTFWIRPASPRSFYLSELLQLVSPEVLKSLPGAGQSEWSEAAFRPVLQWYAHQLREHAIPLLKGDVSVCEDLLIMSFCG